MGDDRTEKAKLALTTLFTIMEKLDALADSDYVYTDDEIILFDHINANLDHYFVLLEKFIEDNVITDEELDEMKKFEKKIVEDAKSKAFEDGKISEDEKALLDKLVVLLEALGTGK